MIRMEALLLFPLSSHKGTSLHPQSLIATGASLQPFGITVLDPTASYCKLLLLLVPKRGTLEVLGALFLTPTTNGNNG